MEELARRDGTEMAILDDLSRQARYYVENIALNMIQLGRVFAEAKKLVKHGEWGAWLRENTGISERYAQQYMQAYARFGENPAIAQVGDKSKI